MKRVTIATIGMVDQDRQVLQSLLTLVGESRQLQVMRVDAPERAHLIFLGHLPPERLGDAVRAHGHHAELIYCCTSGEPPPPGVRTLAHCPPRLAELAKVLDAVAEAAVARGEAAARSTEAVDTERFDLATSIAGAILARLPRILIDQPLLVRVPGFSPILVDVRSGVRLVHAEPGWFASAAGWRVPATDCEFIADRAASELSRCRAWPVRPLAALRFWGILAASGGRPGGDWGNWAAVGLKKFPDFSAVPHLAWHPILARQMVGQTATPSVWAHAVRRPLPEVVDFLNASAIMGWLSGR